MTQKQKDKEKAMKFLDRFRGRTVYARVNSVSRSGMSRRIEYYTTTTDGDIIRIGYYIALAIDYPYNVDKGGVRADGCGMDMIFHVLSVLNYAYAQWKTGKSIQELLKTKEFGEHIYDNALFDVGYRSL
jgi:hypothetical protein